MLKQIIADRIKREGPIPFSEFMKMALYYPDYGYYTSPHTEIGVGGDFYTSPHVHPVFGAVIGKQIEEMWRSIGMPETFHIIEIGAGRGYLAADMLDFLRDTEFYNTIKYNIVEVNPHIIHRQKELLEAFHHRITWIESLAEIPPVRGCIISNELLDAFPVHIIHVRSGELQEVYVKNKDDTLCEACFDCRTEIDEYLEEFAVQLPDDYRTEINFQLKNWLGELSHVLEEGFIFTIDYGYPAWDYYSPARARGTLLCYYQHQINENPYEHIGKQDITAHVNFSAVKKWGELFGFRTIGYSSQGTFLIALRIDEILKEKINSTNDSIPGYEKVSSLVSPEGFGESHKVLIQYKGDRDPQLSGFSVRNRANTL